jgi:predicted metal-binding protein
MSSIPSGGCAGHYAPTLIVTVREEEEVIAFETCMGMGVHKLVVCCSV